MQRARTVFRKVSPVCLFAGVAIAGVGVGACGSGGGFPDARVIDASQPTGTFSLAWTVTNTTGTTISCDAIGASTVQVAVHNVNVLGGTNEVFSCSALRGKSPALPVGTYEMQFQLVGLIGQLATAPEVHDLAIEQNTDTPVSPLTFAVDATGNLKLTISSGKAAGNCAATPTGAGITTTSIQVTDSTNTCVPMSFAIGAGATQPPSTYNATCPAATPGPCIDSDQLVTATGIASGNYTIHVAGAISAATCYRNNDSLPVPPLGHDLTRTLNLAFQTGTPGC